MLLFLMLLSCGINDDISYKLIGDWQYKRKFTANDPQVESTFGGYDNLGKMSFYLDGTGVWNPTFDFEVETEWMIEDSGRKITIIKLPHEIVQFGGSTHHYELTYINKENIEFVKHTQASPNDTLVITETIELSRI